MVKKKTGPKVWLFLAAELVLYLAFLSLDYKWLKISTIFIADVSAPNTADLSNCFRYLSVFLCFWWGLGKKERRLQRAQFMVLAADFYLLFTDYFIAGILSFIGVQICYRNYLRQNKFYVNHEESLHNVKEIRKKERMILLCLLVFGLCTVLLKSLVMLVWNMDQGLWNTFHESSILFAAVAYAGLLITNQFLARRRGSVFMRAGLFLLLMCDIHVAFYNMPVFSGTGLIQGLKAWQEQAGNLMWVFYLPSQVFVALEAMRREKA